MCLILRIRLLKLKNLMYICPPQKWSRGRVARQRSAKPCTAVRIRPRPLKGLPLGGLFSFAAGFCSVPDSGESIPSQFKAVYDFEFLLSVESAQECPRPQKVIVFDGGLFSFASGFCSAPDSDESVPSL